MHCASVKTVFMAVLYSIVSHVIQAHLDFKLLIEATNCVDEFKIPHKNYFVWHVIQAHFDIKLLIEATNLEMTSYFHEEQAGKDITAFFLFIYFICFQEGRRVKTDLVKLMRIPGLHRTIRDRVVSQTINHGSSS